MRRETVQVRRETVQVRRETGEERERRETLKVWRVYW